MSLFIPEGYCNVHFVSSVASGPEVTFAFAVHLIDPTPVDIPAAYDAFVDFGEAIGWPVSVRILAVRTETGTATPGEPILGEATGGESGSGSADLCPPQVSFLTRKNSNSGGRKNRGRAFIPHVQEALVDDNGFLENATVDNLNDAQATFMAAMTAALEADGVFILHTDPDDAPTEVTGGGFESKVATQRRRFDR